MNIKNINYGWKFFKAQNDALSLGESSYESVNLPHTWNNLDGQDGGGNYFRGSSVYEKAIDLCKKDSKEYYLEFKGVNSIAKVYVNGEFIVEHRGGFSTFRSNITKNLKNGLNVIRVLVDNGANDYVYPQTADFTFFGGIYRDVNLLEVNPSRFDLDYYGGEGVMITPILKNKSANVNVKWFVTNPLDRLKVNVRITFNGELVNESLNLSANSDLNIIIDNPRLWDAVESPALYEANLELVDGNEILDTRTINFGIRSFSVDKDGFYLNGRKYNLHGVSRHQDRINMGWAITKKEHNEDMELIKEVGANTIRLAHYQHDDYFYDLCDKEGMVVWAEIPYISVHMDNGNENALSQMRELIIQEYNHPSICFWGISNEITIGGETPSQLEFHKELNKMVKELDPTRITTMACLSMCDPKSPLTMVSDIISYNHYFGWYLGEMADNGKWLDEFREEFNDRPLGLSEYGCEAITTLHSDNPKKGDYTEEYQALYHENMLKTFEERPWLWSTHVWNMFDFAVDSRDEGGCKGRNNKGLVTYDRQTKKDSFFIYKAYWSNDPFVHICSKRYQYRNNKEITIKVYSNQPKVSLYVNNKLVCEKEGNKIFEFKIKLGLAAHVKAVSGDATDEATFKRCLLAKKCYHLKEEKKKVQNWFLKDGVKYEFKFPSGKFSIRDKFNTIYKTPEGKAVLLSLIEEALKKMSPNGDHDPEKFLKNTKKLIGGMTVERIANFAGDKISQEMLFNINEALNKIDKPSEEGKK